MCFTILLLLFTTFSPGGRKTRGACGPLWCVSSPTKTNISQNWMAPNTKRSDRAAMEKLCVGPKQSSAVNHDFVFYVFNLAHVLSDIIDSEEIYDLHCSQPREVFWLHFQKAFVVVHLDFTVKWSISVGTKSSTQWACKELERFMIFPCSRSKKQDFPCQ